MKKAGILVIALLACAFARAQSKSELPAVPASEFQRIELAGDHMIKAGKLRGASVLVLAIAGAFCLANESQRNGANYDEVITWAFAGAGSAGFIGLQLWASEHDKKAGRLLHRE